MKQFFALLIAAAMILSLAACGNSGADSKSETSKTEATQKSNETEGWQMIIETDAPPTTPSPAADMSSWNWVKGELDCYDYKDQGVPCYLSFDYPDNFKPSKEDSSGLQYRGYNFDPSNADATANNSPYGIYVYFNQGSYGAKRETLEADIAGGFTERELGGRKVLFGKSIPDKNTGSNVFSYYTSYDDEEYARIWIILCDPEEDSEFRKTFEQSMNFTKE